MKKTYTMRTNNKNLTAKLNYWSDEKRGQALNARTGKFQFFGNGEQLLQILDGWKKNKKNSLTIHKAII